MSTLINILVTIYNTLKRYATLKLIDGVSWDKARARVTSLMFPHHFKMVSHMKNQGTYPSKLCDATTQRYCTTTQTT